MSNLEKLYCRIWNVQRSSNLIDHATGAYSPDRDHLREERYIYGFK